MATRKGLPSRMCPLVTTGWVNPQLEGYGFYPSRIRRGSLAGYRERSGTGPGEQPALLAMRERPTVSGAAGGGEAAEQGLQEAKTSKLTPGPRKEGTQSAPHAALKPPSGHVLPCPAL